MASIATADIEKIPVSSIPHSQPAEFPSHRHKESSSSLPPNNSVESQPPSSTETDGTVPGPIFKIDRNVKWQIAATYLSLFMEGISDGSTGALIPYFQVRYQIGLALVALV